MLKAYFVLTNDGAPPLTHRLVFLAEKSWLALSAEQQELLEAVTDFNLEARYPMKIFLKRCTRDFTLHYLHCIKNIKECVMKNSVIQYVKSI
jgi:hypothetical protein